MSSADKITSTRTSPPARFWRTVERNMRRTPAKSALRAGFWRKEKRLTFGGRNPDPDVFLRGFSNGSR